MRENGSRNSIDLIKRCAVEGFVFNYLIHYNEGQLTGVF